MKWYHPAAGVFWAVHPRGYGGCYAVRHLYGMWIAYWEPTQGDPVELGRAKTAKAARAICTKHYWDN